MYIRPQRAHLDGKQRARTEDTARAASRFCYGAVFEPAFCRFLIDLHDGGGAEDSGFMRELDGRTVGILDRNDKSRRDYSVGDADHQAAIRVRVARRLLPEISKVFNCN